MSRKDMAMKLRILSAAVLSTALGTGLVASALPSPASAAVFVSVGIAPPPLPVYAQPMIPAPGYLWTPGYWAWDANGGDYYWVPGTWVAPPYVGALWTPGYWGWSGGNYLWHGGYWGRSVGFYGGVNYGYGYGGRGYQGGRWDGNVFAYNRSVNNVNERFVHNTYNTTVIDNHARTSFNGGQGGIAARPMQDERGAREGRAGPTSLQRQHEQFAAHDPGQRFGSNHGAPTQAAMPRAAAFGNGPRGGPGEGRGPAMHEQGRVGPQGGGHEGGRPGGGGHEGGRPGGGHEGGHGGGGEHR
jgi:WXXGXW repeat (2 copies)